jgi:transcriptional regulator with XRE-family HTH domain
MKTRNKAEMYNSPEIDEILNDISAAELNRTRNRMQLAAKIDDGIKAKGWKKTDFAREMKKSPPEISKWLSGTHNFTSDTLFDIGEVLGIKLINIDEPAEFSYKFQPVMMVVHITPDPNDLNSYLPNDLFSKSKRIGVEDIIYLTQTTSIN